MKKLMTALLGAGLLLSCNVSAYSSNCSNTGYNNTSSPKFCGDFYIGLTGFYLQPNGSRSDLNDESNWLGQDPTINDLVTAEFASNMRRIDPDYKWQYEVIVGYDIPCTANNIELSYFHLNTKDHLHSDLSDNALIVSKYFIANGQLPFFGEDPLTAYDNAVQLEYKVDKIDLTVGRQIKDVCGGFKLHPAIGIRYAQLEHRFDNHFEAASDDNFFHADNVVYSEFRGQGPVLALDARYGWTNAFGIVGHFDTSLIVGSVRSNNNITLRTIDGDDTGGAYASWSTPTSNRLVSSVSGKLGIDYTHCYCNKSSLTIEVGYLASKYFDAFDLTRGDVLMDDMSSSNLPDLRDVETNNFSYRGPYINLTVHV